MNLPLPNHSADRDPVAIAIEKLLVDMQTRARSFRKESQADSVTLHFGDLQSTGPNVDIALVRLANAMMDDPNLMSLLIQTLEPHRSAAA